MKQHGLVKAIIGASLSLMALGVTADPLLEQAKKLEARGQGLTKSVGLTKPVGEGEIKKALANFNDLTWTHILPINNLVMIENKDGEKILMDTEARIAIRGNVEVYDLWNKRPINTLADAKASWLVSLDNFNIKTGDLASYKFGLDKKKPDITIFVDPLGDYNSSLFEQMRAMAGDYAFEIILTPLLGDASQVEALKLWCSRDQEKSLESLMNSKPSQEKIFPTCDKNPIIKGLGLAGILHFKGLPHLIRSDGLQNQGTPNNLKEFMTRSTDNLGKVDVKEAK